VRRKAPRLFRRCCPSRGGIRGEPRLGRRAFGSSRPIGDSNRRPGCPKLHEEGTRDTRQRARGSAFARELRPVSCPVHASGTRRASSRCVQLAVRRPPVRQRTSGQRNRHRLVPASSGAKAPLACEDRRLVGCARASIQVAEVGERRRGPEKRAYPLAAGHVDGDPTLEGSARIPRGRKSVGRQHRGGQAAELEQAGAGRSKGRCGAKVFARWKAPRVICSSVSFTRADGRRPRRPSRVSCTRERHGPRRGGDRGVRGPDRTHRGGKTTPIAVTLRGSCGPPKRVALPCSRRPLRPRRRASVGRSGN